MKNFDPDKYQPNATNSKISDDDLKKLLSLPKKWYSLFCWHNWIIWRYGGVSKLHRVCNKCNKKQMSADVVIHGGVTWIKDSNFK